MKAGALKLDQLSCKLPDDDYLNPGKSASITLRANGSILTLWAVRTTNGATTTVTTKHPNEKTVRGMSEQHKSFDAAKARLDALAKDAEKQGWVRGKFQASKKPDAFSTMPAPPTMPASSEKTGEAS